MGMGVNTSREARKSNAVVEMKTHEQTLEPDGHLSLLATGA